MAERKFLVDINLNGNQLNNVRLQNATGAPSVGNGGIYYKSTDNKLYFNKNGTWTALAEGGVALTDITMSGDVNGTIVITDGVAAITTSLSATGTETIQDLVGTQFTTNATHNGVSVSYDDAGSGGISITNTDKGSSQYIFKTIAVSGQSDIVADSNTDTLTVASGSGITLTTDATTDTLTIANAGVLSIAGTTNQVSVAGTGSGPYTGAITLSLPQDIHTGANPTFAGVTAGKVTVGVTTDNTIDTTADNLTIQSAGGTTTLADATVIVSGNLTVNGTTTTVNSETLTVNDNVIVLNNNVTGSPTENAGIEIERGTSTNAALTWDETNDRWTAGLAGSEAVILLSGVATASDINGFTESVQDVVGDNNFTKGTNSLSVTYDDTANTLTFDTTLASTSYLSKTSGLAVDITSLESKLVTDKFTKKYSVNNPSLTASGGVFTWTITHNLATQDTTVQIYNVTSGETVEMQIVRDGSPYNTVTATWNDTASAGSIAADTYRAVVVG